MALSKAAKFRIARNSRHRKLMWDYSRQYDPRVRFMVAARLSAHFTEYVSMRSSFGEIFFPTIVMSS